MARIDWKSVRVHPDQQKRLHDLVERLHDVGEIPRKKNGQYDMVGSFTWLLKAGEEAVSQIERETPSLLPREESPL